MDPKTAVGKFYDLQDQIFAWTQSAILLLLRGYWGWEGMWNGWGKLHNIPEITRWFRDDLHIPMPGVNAYMASGTEFLGGMILFLGLGGRAAAVPLAFTMCVAFLTSDWGGLQSLWMSEDACKVDPTCTGDFLASAPLTFLMVYLVVIAFGPGAFSLDGLIRFILGKPPTAPVTAGNPAVG
jgi:putative oxidoreductase